MAEPTDKSPAPEAAPPPQVEPDALFRLQMSITDFLLGNTKYFGYALGVALLGVGVYGGWDTWRSSREEGSYAEIAAIDFKMPKAPEGAEFGMAPYDDPNDATRLANVEKGAELYEETAKKASGTPAVYAWMKAAETWQRLGKADRRLTALQAAHAVGASDLAGFVAVSAYTSALADAGKTDEALTALRTYASGPKSFYAEEALIQLAQLQANAGKAQEALATIQEFKTRFPDSPRTSRLATLAPAALMPPAAPSAPAAPPSGEPAAPATGSGG